MRGTQSVGVALLLWFAGAVAAAAGTFVFVEFGLTLPRYLVAGSKEAVPKNGGELNYASNSPIAIATADSDSSNILYKDQSSL